MNKSGHIHRFKRHLYKSGSGIYFCVEGGECNFRISIPLSLGRKSICNRCKKPFIMNEYSIRLAKPHCDDCKIRKDKINDFTSEGEARGSLEANELQPLSSSISSLRKRLSNISVAIKDEDL